MKAFLLFLLFLPLPLLCPYRPDGVHDDVESADSLPDRIIKVPPLLSGEVKCILTLSAFSIDRVLFRLFLFSSSSTIKILHNIGYWQLLHHKYFFDLDDNSQYLPNVFLLKGLFNFCLISIWSLCLCGCEASQHGPWRYSLLMDDQFIKPKRCCLVYTVWLCQYGMYIFNITYGTRKFTLHPMLIHYSTKVTLQKIHSRPKFREREQSKKDTFNVYLCYDVMCILIFTTYAVETIR